MLYIKKLTHALLLLSLVANAPFRLAGAHQINQEEGTANFGRNITAHAYDPSTGTIYVATEANNGGYTLAKAGRGDTVFTPLANLGGGGITAAEAVVLANAGTANYAHLPSPLMRFVGDGDNNFLVAINADTTGGALAHKHISLINGQTGVTLNSAELKDANNAAITAAGPQTALKLAVGKSSVLNQAKAFAYVYPQGAQPGADNSGVCSATIDLANGTIMADTIGGHLGQAQKLDAATGIPAGGTGGVLGFQNTAATQATNGCWVNDLYWDEDLQMLYAGLSVRNNTRADGDQVYALTRAPLAAPGGALGAFVKIDGLAPGGANASGPLHSGTPEAKTSVSTVFALNGNGTPNCPTAMVQKISGMRTSTNLKYLIVNAHVLATTRIDGLSNNIIPYIWAVRLSTANDGTKGNVVKNADGTALANGWTGADLGATLVGNGPLPFIAASNQFVTQLESVGDAVFASIGSRATVATTNDNNNKCAIYGSRALFGQAGQIIGWTPWERVFPSADAALGFAIDPMLGQIWQIRKEARGINHHKVVTRTQWQAVVGDPAGTTLASRLNHDFAQGCTAILDIPQGTNGIRLPAATKNSSLALFGGNGIVTFARTESGGYHIHGGTNIMTTDFSDTANYKLTTLPQGAGYVRTLTFSRNEENATKGYFFAGTDTGLYVYVGNTTDANPAGYNGANLALNLSTAAPFNGANAGWIRMDAALAGAVTALDAIGSHLFAVEHDYSQPGSVTCRLIRYAIGDNVNTIVGSRVIIAASGQTTIPTNTLFNDFAIVCDDGDRANAHGLLATNVGIYQSPADLATVAANAAWLLVPDTDASLLTTMIKTNKRVMTTNDGKALSPMIAYLDGNGTSWHEMYLKHLAPAWNAHAINATEPKGYALEGSVDDPTQRLVQFWTDGARRFYSEINNTELATGDELKSCPFNPAAFGMTGKETITANTTPAHIFWIENISGIGEVMVGTEYGVLSLN